MNELPRWTARIDALRPTTEFTDLLMVVGHHFRVFADAEAFLGPYNARQRGKKFYEAPTREVLRERIKQGGMNDVTYFAFLGSLIKFCEQTKGTFALPTPHPSTIHSVQLPQPAFELSQVDLGGKMTHELKVPGAEPVYLNGVRYADQVKFVIVRPKLSKLGTPAVKTWEALLFNQNHGYLPTWADTNLNPRWSGLMH